MSVPIDRTEAAGKTYPLPILAVYGKSNSGKTTLVERLIAALSARQIRVMSVKGHLHEIDLDMVGKDSWRHQKAGAQTSVLATPGGWMAIHQTDERVTIDELAEEAVRRGCAVLVVEGFKDAPVPKLEVTVENRDELDVDEIVEGLIAQL